MNQIEEDKRPKTFREKLGDLYYNLIPLVTVNFFWCLFSIPVVTAFPALAGLYASTNELAHKNNAGWDTFIEGFKQYFWLSWKWGLIVLGGFLLLGFNIWFYGGVTASWGFYVQMVFVWLAIFWAFINMYTFPLLIEQSDKKFRIAMKNSLILLFVSPGKSILMMLITIVTVAISYFLPPLIVVISGGVITLFANQFTLQAIKKAQAIQEKNEKEKKSAAASSSTSNEPDTPEEKVEHAEGMANDASSSKEDTPEQPADSSETPPAQDA